MSELQILFDEISALSDVESLRDVVAQRLPTYFQSDGCSLRVDALARRSSQCGAVVREWDDELGVQAQAFEHTMVGPLLHDGNLQGAIRLARRATRAPFGDSDMNRFAVVCSRVAATLTGLLPNQKGDNPSHSQLTRREREVADFIGRGYTNREIGVLLGISENTVKKFIKRAFAKLSVSSRAELVARTH